jgi:uncharacterized membrane protein YciS (DUF1049 family)
MRINLNFASREFVLASRVYAGLVLGIIISVLIFSGLYISHSSRIKSLGRIKKQITEREAAISKLDETLHGYEKNVNGKVISSTYTEAEFANSAISRRVFSWTLFLNRLEGLVPTGVGITGITPNFQTLYVGISGSAKSIDAVTEFIARLTRSEYFEDVPPTFSTSEEKVQGETGLSLQQFNIMIRYIPGGKAKPPDNAMKGGG